MCLKKQPMGWLKKLVYAVAIMMGVMLFANIHLMEEKAGSDVKMPTKSDPPKVATEHFVPGTASQPPTTFTVKIQDTTADGCSQHPNSFAVDPNQTSFLDSLRRAESFVWMQVGQNPGIPVKLVDIKLGVHYGKDIITYTPTAPDVSSAGPKSFTPATFTVTYSMSPPPAPPFAAPPPTPPVTKPPPIVPLGSPGSMALKHTPLQEQGSIGVRLNDLAAQVASLASEYSGITPAGVEPVGVQSAINLT